MTGAALNPHHPTSTGDSWAGGLEKEIPTNYHENRATRPQLSQAAAHRLETRAFPDDLSALSGESPLPLFVLGWHPDDAERLEVAPGVAVQSLAQRLGVDSELDQTLDRQTTFGSTGEVGVIEGPNAMPST